jgi:hypothetical protein
MATPGLSVGSDEDDSNSEVAIDYSSDEDEGPVVSAFLSSSWQHAHRYFHNQAIDDSRFAINYDSDEEEGPLVSTSLSSLLFIVTNRSLLFPKPGHRGRGGRQAARLVSGCHWTRLP